MARKSKFSFLIRRRVKVTLRDSRTVSGQLLAYDKCMNIVLSEAVDIRNGEARRIGLMILRGECIVSITLDSAFVNNNETRVPASLIIDQKTASNVN